MPSGRYWAFGPGVVPEHRRPRDHDEVVALELLADGGDRHAERPAEARVVGGEGDPADLDSQQRRGLEPLRQRHAGVPAAVEVDVGAEDQQRVRGPVEAFGELGDRLRRRGGAGGELASGGRGGVGGGLGVPVVERHRDEDRPGRGAGGEVHRAGERRRDHRRRRRFEAALDQRFRQGRRVDVGQLPLQGHQGPRLLAAEDDQRRAGELRVDQRAHRLADAGRGVEADEDRPAGRLRIGVGHRHAGALLQREDVTEVLRELVEEGELVGAGIAEDGRHPERAEDLVGGVMDGWHPVSSEADGRNLTLLVG